jgi:broad specificity phosphatase PhoE
MKMKRNFKRVRLLIVITFAALWCLNFSYTFAGEASKGPDLYFVRHAETVANATGIYTKENESKFSKKGLKQIEDLTKMFGRYKFDFICVSPQVRALETILPYLKEHNMTAEIWPELSECLFQKGKGGKSVEMFTRGETIVLSNDMKDYFQFREPTLNYFYKEGSYREGLLRLDRACKLIEERFGQSGKSVLIVGHNLSGGRLIEMLQRMQPMGQYSPLNAHIWHLKLRPDGKFGLVEQNVPPTAKTLNLPPAEKALIEEKKE